MNRTDTNDKLWIVLCHLSVFIGAGLLLPLIVYLVTKEDSESPIPAHAKETLNFHISLFIYMMIGLATIVIAIGFLIIIVVAIGSCVLAIIGAIRASNGELYHYPLTIRFIK